MVKVKGEEQFDALNEDASRHGAKDTRRLADLKQRQLINVLADTLAEVDAHTRNNTLVEVKTKALIDTLADKVAENKAKTLFDSG